MTKKVKKEIIINLMEEVNYPGVGGQMAVGRAIKIFSPSVNQAEFVAVLDCAFHKAMIKSAKEFSDMKSIIKEMNSGKEKEQELTKVEVLSILKSFCSAEELKNCYHAVKHIITGGKQCQIDDVKISLLTFEKEFSYEDLDNILGEYIANFIVASPKD